MERQLYVHIEWPESQLIDEWDEVDVQQCYPGDDMSWWVPADLWREKG